MALSALHGLHLPMKPSRSSTTLDSLVRLFWHLFSISVSCSLLFFDNVILLAVLILARLRPTRSTHQTQHRSVQFYPKTVLVTGIGTPHGLALARAWGAGGHRVVGADVADVNIPIRSGGSMSQTLLVYYRVPKDHYISRILDIVQREKVDVWIPCSSKVTAIEDATARQIIESRASCRCITFDTDLVACFANPDSFRQFLADRDLPVLERHEVKSRDNIHKILHRSPSKSYRLSSNAIGRPVILPKRTLSTTYSEVSEIKISDASPWMLQQQNRLGHVFADLLVVRGYVHAIKVRLAEARSPHLGVSRMDEALAVAIHRLMKTFAEKGGARMTGHLSVRLLIDEEFDASAVRHTIHIADCVLGAVAVENLLSHARCPVEGYLTVLSAGQSEPSAWDVTATLLPHPHPEATITGNEIFVDFLSWLLPLGVATRLMATLEAEVSLYLFWKNPLFSSDDPLPWWWQVHVYQPLREIWVALKEIRAAGLAGGSSRG